MLHIGRLVSAPAPAIGERLVIAEPDGRARMTSPVLAVERTRRGSRILTRSSVYVIDRAAEVYIAGVECAVCGRRIGAADPHDVQICFRCGTKRTRSVIIDQDSLDTLPVPLTG